MPRTSQSAATTSCASATTLSTPSPHAIRSTSPSRARMTSSPASPEMVSAPVPPSMMSAPPPPPRVSSPGPPRSALGPSSPVTVSPVRLPSMSSIWVTRAVPVLTRSMPAGASWPRTSPAGRPSVWTSAYMRPLRSASSSAAVGLNGPAMRSKAVVSGCWRSKATGPVVPGAAGPWMWAPLASEPMPATAMSTESWPEGASTATTSPTAVDARGRHALVAAEVGGEHAVGPGRRRRSAWCGRRSRACRCPSRRRPRPARGRCRRSRSRRCHAGRAGGRVALSSSA